MAKAASAIVTDAAELRRRLELEAIAIHEEDVAMCPSDRRERERRLLTVA